MPRARDLGIEIGALPTGPTNSVLDVAGVGLGHATVVATSRPPRARRRPHRRHRAGAGRGRLPPAAAPPGGAVLNGAGECTGFLTAARVGMRRDAGLPDLDDAARPGVRRRVRDRARAGTRRWPTTSCIPVVAECDDSFLNDCRRMQVDRRRRPGGARRGAGLARLGRRRRPRARSASGTGHVVPGLQGRHRHRVAGDRRSGHTVGGAADDQLRRRASELRRRRRPGRAAARRRPPPGPHDARRLVHRRRRHRRARSTAPAARGWPAGSGSAWPAPGRSPTTAAARSSWPSAPTCAHRPRRRQLRRRAAAGGPRARRAVRGGRRRHRGGGPQLDARRRRPRSGRDGNTSPRASTPTRSARLLGEARR